MIEGLVALAPVLVGIFGGGTLVAAINALASRGKMSADVTVTLADKTMAYADDLVARLDAVTARLDATEAKVAELQAANLAQRSEILTMSQDLAGKALRIESLTHERDQWKSKADALARVEAEQQARIVELEAKVAALEAKVAALESSKGAA